MTLSLSTITGLEHIEKTDWDRCAGDEDPFLSYDFLYALEQSGSVGDGTGWHPIHMVLKEDSRVVAVMPLYLKTHSMGEYVFDHAFADAYERAGGAYYPKLVSAVPFTPVRGRRILKAQNAPQNAAQYLINGAMQVAENIGASSLHINFCTDDLGRHDQLLERHGYQFHFDTTPYCDFDDFLSSLSSSKRKTLRKERQKAQGFGGEIKRLHGEDIKPRHWDAFWHFYQDTGARKWGTPYLTREFFDIMHETMRDKHLLVWAENDERPVAGALNFIGKSKLYGRYWGASEWADRLHFELCYYQAMDHAFAHNIPLVEAGAQGEHKISRGYLPVLMRSWHWFRDPGLHRAVSGYLEQERAHISSDIKYLSQSSPFKKSD